MATVVHLADRLVTQVFLADPVSGTPTPPPGSASAHVNTLWSYLGWGVAVICCLAIGGLCAVLWAHRGQSNENLGKIGWALGGALFFGSIGAVVGALTGT